MSCIGNRGHFWLGHVKQASLCDDQWYAVSALWQKLKCWLFPGDLRKQLLSSFEWRWLPSKCPASFGDLWFPCHSCVWIVNPKVVRKLLLDLFEAKLCPERYYHRPESQEEGRKRPYLTLPWIGLFRLRPDFGNQISFFIESSKNGFEVQCEFSPFRIQTFNQVLSTHYTRAVYQYKKCTGIYTSILCPYWYTDWCRQA